MTIGPNLRVLVTGASGWTGRHMCNLAVAPGAEVSGWIRNGHSIPGVTNFRVDLNDQLTVDHNIS